MKVIIILFLLLLTTPAFSELTKEDLQTLKEDLRTYHQRRNRRVRKTHTGIYRSQN